MKEEVTLLAKQNSELLIEYINHILSDEEELEGRITIFSSLLEDCKIDINIPSKNIKNQQKTNILPQYIDILNGQILDSLIDNYMESETMGVTKYYSRNNNGKGNGINIISNSGSKINIDFACKDEKFEAQIKRYNATLDEYVEKQMGQLSKAR